MYMSYCRYEGTAHELRACMGDVEAHLDGYADYAVSDREVMHFAHLVEEFHDWMRDLCLIDDEGRLDRDALEDVCNALKRGNEG